jgi:hypothetical protein
MNYLSQQFRLHSANVGIRADFRDASERVRSAPILRDPLT